MNAEEYRQKSRKKIVCPSGLELTIRKVQTIDFLRIGVMPDVFSQFGENIKSAKTEDIIKLNTMFLVRGVVPDENIKIVDKPIGEASGNELSVEELDDTDMQFIITEVSQFTTGGKQIDADSFREEPMAESSGQDGPEILGDAQPIAAP